MLQRHGKGDDGEHRHNDCPGLGTKPLKPLCVELNRAKDCRGGEDPTVVSARCPSSNGDDDIGPTDDERGLRYMEMCDAPGVLVRP